MADISFNDHRFRLGQQTPISQTSSFTDSIDTSHSHEVLSQINKVVRTKISNLKQEVANKDREAKRERAMRKAAEKQEQDKATEGRGNLLPGKKERTPPRGVQQRHPSPGKQAESRENLTESVYSSEDDGELGEKRGRRYAKERRADYDADWGNMSATHERRRHEPQGWYGDYGPPPPPPHPAYLTHNPWISPHRVPPVPSYDPRLLHTIGPDYPSHTYQLHVPPTAPSLSHHHPRRHSLSGEDGRQSAFSGPTLVIPAETGQGDRSAGTPQQIPVTIQIQQSPSNTTTQPDVSPVLPVSTVKESQLDISQTSETVNTGVGASPPPHAPLHRPFDERGLPLLLEELGVAKDTNKVLSEKCSEAEREIESLQMQLGVKDAMSEAELAAKGAALIEEIYLAQREHDDAIMTRLKMANDERDDAFARLQKYQKSKDGFDSGTDVNSNEEDNIPAADSTINNLLSRLTVADNRTSIDKYGSAIIGRISKTKGRKEQITSEEMRAILKEKDVAVAKCKKLEREVIELRKNRESSKSRNNKEKSLKAQLEITCDERDKALLALKKMKEEYESIKMYYSLHKSLSQEANLRDQFNTTLGSIEEQVKTRDEVLARTQLNNSQLAQQVRAAHDERNAMAAQLQRAQLDNQQLRNKTQQMERLVSVLRKKVAEGAVKTV